MGLNALLVMIEKIKITRDNKKFYAAMLTNLSKAFDCICHDLHIVKLSAHEFDRNALKFIYDYHSGRSQKTKVGSLFSAYIEIIYDERASGSLLFNIDLFYLFLKDYCSDFENRPVISGRETGHSAISLSKLVLSHSATLERTCTLTLLN